MPKVFVSRQVRIYVKDRACERCEYCQFPLEYSHDAFHIEHIMPSKDGGSNDPVNLAFACDGCNTNKGSKKDGKDPMTGETHPLFDPRNDNWSEHFSWSSDFTNMIGLTPVGRATIATLKLNRPGLLKVRKLMFSYGVHPPK